MAGTITIETVRRENAKLRQQNAVLRHENASFRADNDSLLHENQVLKAKIAKFENAGSNNVQATPKLFSQSSFGFPMDPNYLSNFTPIVIPSSPVLSNLPSSPTIAGAPALSSPGPGLGPSGFPLPNSSNIVLPNQFSPHSPTLPINQSASFPNLLQATPNTVLRPPQTVNRSSSGSSPGSLAAPSLPMNPNAVPFTPIPPKGPQKPRSNSPSVGMVMPSRSKSSEDRSQGKNQPENSKRASATKKSNSKGSKKLTPPQTSQKSNKSEKTSELQSPDPQRSVSRSPSKPRKKSRKSKKKGATPNKETKKNVKDVKKDKQTLDKNGSVANAGGTPPTSASSSVSPKPSVQNSKSPKSSNDSNSRGRGNASRGRSRGNRHRRRRR